MRHIKKLVDHISDEVDGAKDYAESYVECKAKGNSANAQKFKSMAEDELRHAMYFHEMAVKEIEDLSKVYTPPASMMEKWEKSHKEYVEKVAWVKQMLAM